MSEDSKYQKHYSEERFWRKLKNFAKDAGLKVVYSGLTLYYALESPNTSTKDKAIIYGGLGYLILPIDAIPDLVPLAGYVDDLGVLLFAAARVIGSIDQAVRDKAKAKLNDLFGQEVSRSEEILDVDQQISEDNEMKKELD